jgi:phosphoribosylformylglycinamidine synthase
MSLDVNPNGSALCIEGISSPDGRILGKMGHTERSTTATFQNVPGTYYQPLFESGVNYFA